MAIFSVSFVLYLLDNTMLNGAIGICTMFFGGFGIALFAVLKLSRDNTEQIMQDAKLDDDESTDETSEKKQDEENND